MAQQKDRHTKLLLGWAHTRQAKETPRRSRRESPYPAWFLGKPASMRSVRASMHATP